jgi:hypothetical protein
MFSVGRLTAASAWLRCVARSHPVLPNVAQNPGCCFAANRSRGWNTRTPVQPAIVVSAGTRRALRQAAPSMAVVDTLTGRLTRRLGLPAWSTRTCPRDQAVSDARRFCEPGRQLCLPSRPHATKQSEDDNHDHHSDDRPEQGGGVLYPDREVAERSAEKNREVAPARRKRSASNRRRRREDDTRRLPEPGVPTVC